MILALAGRRVDPPDASIARFPLENTAAVRERIAALLTATQTSKLVCSAACGADLLGLEAARELALDCYIVLPFSKHRFRVTSVVDRPGEWGPLFDRAIERAEATGNLLTLDLPEANDASFLAVNRAILVRARAIARSMAQPLEAVLVWDGQPRDAQDITAAFGEEAKTLGIPLREVSTLKASSDKMTAWPHPN
jgi:hypothetical protein